MLPAPAPDELADWLLVGGTPTAVGSLRWTPGERELSFGWSSFGAPPLLVQLPAGPEVRFTYGGPGRWVLLGPDGPLAGSDGRRAVVWRAGRVETGAQLIAVPDPELLLLPQPPTDDPGGAVVADERLGRPCWRWTARDEVRWVDDETGCLLAHHMPAGMLELVSFQPGAPVDPAAFDLPEPATTPTPTASPRRVRPEPPRAPALTVPWWPHGTSSFPVAGDPEAPSLLVELLTDGRRPSVWVGVAPLGQRAPVRPGARSRRWDGDDCSLSLSWTRDLADEDVERVAASIPRRWP